jgi:hypothetical protein
MDYRSGLVMSQLVVKMLQTLDDSCRNARNTFSTRPSLELQGSTVVGVAVYLFDARHYGVVHCLHAGRTLVSDQSRRYGLRQLPSKPCANTTGRNALVYRPLSSVAAVTKEAVLLWPAVKVAGKTIRRAGDFARRRADCCGCWRMPVRL